MSGFSYRIEKMNEKDLHGVANLENGCFSDPWSENSLAKLLTDEAFGFVAREENGNVVGYVGVWKSSGEGQITNLAVLPDHRRAGIGENLMKKVLEEAKENAWEEVSLEVRVSNEAAISLYEKLGFFVAGTRKKFYRNPSEDAFVMLWNASGEKER